MDEELDAASDTWLAADEAVALEGEQHLVDRGRRDAEMALQIGFGRRSAEHLGISVDEGEVLPLLRGEARR